MDRVKALFSSVTQGSSSSSSRPADVTEAANTLIRSLNPRFQAPSSINDVDTLKALSLLWGRPAEHDEKDANDKIIAARKQFVAGAGSSAEARARVATEFDNKVTQILCYSLGPRNRALYLSELNRNKGHWANGSLTEARLHEKMAAMADKLGVDAENGISRSTIRQEVQSALIFVSDETRLMHAMHYLWGGKPSEEMSADCKQFDAIVTDLLEMMFKAEQRENGRSGAQACPRDEFVERTRREVIKESRTYLGSLLQNQESVDAYTKTEAALADRHLKGGGDGYQKYKSEMLAYVTGSLWKEVGKTASEASRVRLKSLIEAAAVDLADAVKDVPKALGMLFGGLVERPLGPVWSKFIGARDNYLEITENSGLSLESRKLKFMSAAKEALIGKLPAAMRADFKAVLKELNSYLRQGFVTEKVYERSALYWLNKAAKVAAASDASETDEQSSADMPVASKLNAGDGADASKSFDQEVQNALKIFGNKPEDLVDALAYLWGAPMDRFNERGFDEFIIVRNKYIEDQGGKPVSGMPVHCNFVEAARTILAERLPESLRAHYRRQQKTLKEFGMDATSIAESTAPFVASLPKT